MIEVANEKYYLSNRINKKITAHKCAVLSKDMPFNTFWHYTNKSGGHNIKYYYIKLIMYSEHNSTSSGEYNAAGENNNALNKGYAWTGRSNILVKNHYWHIENLMP